MPTSFELLAECPVTGARAGLLHTPHGDVETPVFMPVGTQATVKGLTQRDLAESLGARILLANTYHLFLRPGHEAIARLGGLHKFMSWPHAILTDSGGFQVFSLDTLRKVTEEGVLFHSHLNGDAHLFTPESTVDVQLALGSDIMMVLDECLAYPATHEAAERSMHRTVRWAEAASKHYRQVGQVVDLPHCSALFPIVQGSMFPDLRRECAAATGRTGRGRLCHRRPLGRRAPRRQPGDGRGHRSLAAARPGRVTSWASGCRRSLPNMSPAAST